MPQMTTNSSQTIKPGNLVVSMSEILGLLKTRLSQSEIDDLIRLVISKRKLEVRPGDVIEASLMNQMLTELADLQTRVAVLEGIEPGVGIPKIVMVQPDGSIKMGEEIRVIGFNLNPNQLTSVTVGNSPVRSFGAGSHDRLLIFDIPPILGVPSGGATALLKVTNKYGSDALSLWVLPSEHTTLSTTFFLTFPQVPSEKLKANKSYEYRLGIEAFTSMAETYTITPTIDAVGWKAEMKDGATEIFIPKSQPQSSKQEVVVIVTTGASGKANLSLKIASKNFPSEWGESESLPLEIDQLTPQPNTEITFTKPPNVFPSSSYDKLNDMVIVEPNKKVTITVNAKLTTPSVWYDISTPVIEDGTSNLWIPILKTGAAFMTTNPDELKQIKITLKLDNTGANEPTVTLKFNVRRRNSSETPAEFTQKVKPKTS